MTKTFQAALALIVGSALTACATEQPSVEQAAIAAETVSMTAKVAAVNQSKRLVTLRGPQGGVVQVKVDPSVKNLANVKVGDTLAVQYREAIALEIVRRGGAPGASVEVVGARAATGQEPAGGVAERIRVTAKVRSVDTANRRVKLQGPNGKVQSFAVQNPNVLRDLKAGDDVEVVYTEAVAVAVEPAKAAKKQ